MTPRTRRRFDATWLPFGMMVGFVVGIGTALAVTDNLLVGAVVGFLIGGALGVVLGLRPRDTSTADEDAEDDRYRAAHGDPTLRRDGDETDDES
ncbi:hypothetical protein BH708_08775 [Brachybacterium sp. P6-10-X1]|uniref:hypothetical protein n=1 Tax=Brachybacterium sp. P6-10-X1 TaxID=1903186 RepID=UPI000971829C|nr:hypothetical protein [Brachybacterium sp. P6-10-X1]APX32799.1 hypothetical protein BH708_08775 [Brachybacterium sp. P6-10-X1]